MMRAIDFMIHLKLMVVWGDRHEQFEMNTTTTVYRLAILSLRSRILLLPDVNGSRMLGGT